MEKLFWFLTSGMFLIKKIGGISYFLIFKELAFFLGFLVIIVIVLSFFVGLLGGWFLAKGKRLLLLKISKKDRVLVLAPHPDDETLGCGGLIAYLSRFKIAKKIIFLTNGDSNIYPFVEEKKIRFSPQKFIEIGYFRAKEALHSLRKLGVKKEEVIFLGYPDMLLKQMFDNLEKIVVGKGTKLMNNPYRFSISFKKEYKGFSLEEDLKNIILKFKPTVLIAPHLKDSNKDHRATFLFLKKVLKKVGWQGKVYQYLIHFKLRGLWRIYPGRVKKREFKDWVIYPPLMLWNKENWYSFWLNEQDWLAKKKALTSYKSQNKIPTIKRLFISFLAQNEIFERWSFRH